MSTISSSGTITSAGVGSGLDVESIITKLMAVEQAPLTALQNRATTYNSEISALGQVKSDLSALQDAVKAFSTTSGVYSYKASVADNTIATASADSTAIGGTYSVEVQKLASTHKLMSAAGADASAGGTLTIEVGSVSGGAFTTNGAAVQVTIKAGATLADVASSINAANAGVSATVIHGTDGDQLVVTSQTSGANGLVKISSSDLTDLTYDPAAASGGMAQKTAGQDAIVYVDGVQVANTHSNTVTDAVTGVTLNLLDTNIGDPTTLTVSSDSSALETKLNSFVTAYNNLATLVKGLTGYDTTTKNAGALNGDSTVTQVMSDLRNAIFTVPSGASSSFQTLSSLGIQFQTDGTLKLDTTTLESALTSNYAAAAATITSYGSALGTSLANALDVEGPIASDINGITNTISNITDREDQLKIQLTAIEARYRAQFTALDTLVAQMQTTSSYLTQQLAALTKTTSSS
jgi:flagellar hook-associated protein 2